MDALAKGGGSTSDLRGRKVLIVDDDKVNVLLVREGLSSFGFRFLEAHDGSVALSLIREHRPDLMVLDVEMPGLSGVEICRIVKANQGENGFGFIPVILMTARHGGSKVEGLELGADDYLVKPFNMLELAARVKSMLRLKGLHDQVLEKNRELDRANRELDQKRQELLELSRTDALTGLYNRRYFEERLAEEFMRSHRYRNPLTCVMVDVDHFKRLNDTYGHPFGDQVLVRVAKVVRGALREVDFLARYGGEELVALLPETDAREAQVAAERVRKAIEDIVMSQLDPSVQVAAGLKCTASLGTATFPVDSITAADGLIRSADEALYAAKQGGRNRVRQHVP
jgi:two-component system, cell cycle response regulator